VEFAVLLGGLGGGHFGFVVVGVFNDGFGW
jgi:hypothetical protein